MVRGAILLFKKNAMGTNSRVWQLVQRRRRRREHVAPDAHWSITHQLVLIGRDGGEDGLDEDEGAELLGLEVEQRGGVLLLLDDVDPRLVLVHGVEDDLQEDKQSRNQ